MGVKTTHVKLYNVYSELAVMLMQRVYNIIIRFALTQNRQQ